MSPESLLAIVEGRAAEAERLAALRHAAACGACRADLDLLRSAADAGRGLRRYSVPVLSIAASVVLLAGAAVMWRSLASRSEPLRGGADGVFLVRPSGDVAATEPLLLVWHALPRAARYDVEVVDARGHILFSAATHDSTAALPTRAGMTPGAAYYWWVRALLADGTALRSRAERFRIR